MLADAPKTITWMIFALLAGACIELARRAPDWAALALFAAMIFGAAALVNAAHWMLYRVVAQVRLIVMSRAQTERVLIMQIIAQMQPHHLNYLSTIDPMIITLPGDAGPVVMLMRINGVDIPFDFVMQFFEQSEGSYLVPVGSFAEGTKQRNWAVLLTAHLITQGFAERANGNHSARWTNREGAERWFNMTRLTELAR